MIVTTDEKTGRYRVKIDQVIDGKRVRITKLMPRGFSLENAYRVAERMISEPPAYTFKDKLQRIVNGKPDALGDVYFIKNPSLPGLVKIGMTRASVYERINNLNTGHVSRWKIIGNVSVKHPELVESALHQLFSESREVPKREFFRISDADAIAAMTVCQEVDGIDLHAAINTIGGKRPSLSPELA